MGKPLSRDRVFEFPMDEPHLAYDFFAPGPLPAYVDEPMVGPVVDEIVEPIVEMEEQVIALVIDVEEDIDMLFGDDDSEGFEDDEEVSDAEVADDIAIWEIGPRVSAVEGQVEQGLQTATQRDEAIVGLSLSYRGVNLTPTLRKDLLENVKFPRWVEARMVSTEDQVDYASRGAETLELELRSSLNEHRAHDAQLFS
uniref:Uncharacterized protein n=1 Tax=Tanacetum cinerariifolium TaxID=118510 RepID=A0A699IA25_TANCI|nr:hypothetical protein [Tanacetum cinerariifolium]